jgi:hypothetical protein
MKRYFAKNAVKSAFDKRTAASSTDIIEIPTSVFSSAHP